ncbi:phosphate acyltransferase [Staphylococcus aureus]
MLVYAGKSRWFQAVVQHIQQETLCVQLYKLSKMLGVSRTSGIFFMIKGDEQYIFGDCAINPEIRFTRILKNCK